MYSLYIWAWAEKTQAHQQDEAKAMSVDKSWAPRVVLSVSTSSLVQKGSMYYIVL